MRGQAHHNGAENYFSILKRRIIGVYHPLGDDQLHRYCSEFDFRRNHRDISDGELTDQHLRRRKGSG